MSTAPAESSGAALPPLPLTGASPAEIRGALRADYREDLDRDYQAALVDAGRSLDLAGLHDTVEYWRRRAWITRDEEEHRRVVRRAAELLTGVEPATDELATVTEAKL